MSELLLKAENIRLSYGMREVLSIERLEIYDGERIGIVGENGAGKTTLIKILAGELEPDEGNISRYAPIATISQMDSEGGGADFDARLASEFAAPPEREGLSGGERTRRRIAAALSSRSGVLLADEPTTDLDVDGIERLERHLKEYDGALIMVSHDRALLDAICGAILEIEDTALTRYPGNYTAYRAEKERRRAFEKFEYQQYRSEQARLRASIQGKREHSEQIGRLPSRMGLSEARLHRRSATEVQEKVDNTRKALQSRLSQLEVKERPRDDPNISMRLGANSPIISRRAVEINDMTMRFGSRVLLCGASMHLPTGGRTALIGPNGCGKSTLISRIAGGRDPRVRVSPGVKLGLFTQDHASSLILEATALENVMRDSVIPEPDARAVLARLNIRGDEVHKRAGVLSGGERAKVSLARLLAGDINLFALDEPTNHIDIFTMESLQKLLAEYEGTLLIVTHDRRFIEGVATRLIFFEGDRLVTFEGTYAEWRAHSEAKTTDRPAQIELATIEMRMSNLAARLGRPTKGDDIEAMSAQYDELARVKRELEQDS